ERQRVAVLGTDEADRFLGPLLLSVDAQHACAFARHENGRGLAIADARPARSGAGDDCDLAAESFGHWGRVLLSPYQPFATARSTYLRPRVVHVCDLAPGQPRAGTRVARRHGVRSRVFPGPVAQSARLAPALFGVDGSRDAGILVPVSTVHAAHAVLGSG